MDILHDGGRAVRLLVQRCLILGLCFFAANVHAEWINRTSFTAYTASQKSTVEGNAMAGNRFSHRTGSDRIQIGIVSDDQVTFGLPVELIYGHAERAASPIEKIRAEAFAAGCPRIGGPLHGELGLLPLAFTA